jgi:hypothetical protein
MSLAVFVSNNVFLSGREDLGPATIEVDPLVGRITAVHEHRQPRSKYPHLLAEDWHDYGDNWLLPGLVECVCVQYRGNFRPGGPDCFQFCIRQLVPMST